MAMDPLNRAAFARLKRYFWAHRGGLAVAVVAFLLASATEPQIPNLLKKVLDEGFLKEPTFPLWAVPVVLIGLFTLRGLLSFAGSYMLSRSTTRVVRDIRIDLADALLKADASVFTKMPSGLAVSKVINDPQSASGQVSSAMLTLLRDGTTAVALLIYLFYENWQLTALSLTVMPALMFAVRRLQRRILEVNHHSYLAQNRLVATVEDLARSWRVIRTFGAGPFERERFAEGARDVQRRSLKTAAASALMTPISQTIASVGVALIITLAIYQGRTGQATAGSFTAYVSALLLLISRARHLADVSQPVLSALVVARGCFEVLDAPVEPDRGTYEGSGAARGEIVFDHVVVRYDGAEQAALDGASLRIAPGTTVAFVGSSGAGKTTAVNALLGFADVASGRLLLDGVPVGDWRKAALRQQFAVVSQDIILFDDSIAANVAYARPLDEARLERCLRAAALWDTVQAMSAGIREPIGVNGSRLSGGQRQRLAIARALYKEAPVWIFDEATSALDTDSERAVQQALEQWHGERTMIVIAHRLSTIRRADAIHVFDAGRVVESGTHESLMALGGRYARAVGLQDDAPQEEAAASAQHH